MHHGKIDFTVNLGKEVGAIHLLKGKTLRYFY